MVETAASALVRVLYPLWQHVNNGGGGWEYNSLAEHLSSISETLYLIPQIINALLSWLVFNCQLDTIKNNLGGGSLNWEIAQTWLVGGEVCEELSSLLVDMGGQGLL